MTNLQIVLLSVSIITVLFLLIRIKKSQFLIGDSIFWIFFSVMIFIMAVFPKLSAYFSSLLGFESPSNFIFVVFIFLLVIKVFSLNFQMTALEKKLQKLVSETALKNKDKGQ